MPSYNHIEHSVYLRDFVLLIKDAGALCRSGRTLGLCRTVLGDCCSKKKNSNIKDCAVTALLLATVINNCMNELLLLQSVAEAAGAEARPHLYAH